MGIESLKNSTSAYTSQQETTSELKKGADEKTHEAVSEQNVVLDTEKKTTVSRVQENEGKTKAEEITEQKSATNAKIKNVIDEINKKAHNSEAVFGIHDATNRVTIKIVDKESKEVIKEYPPEETLDMIAKVWELAGIMVDEKR